MGPALWEALVAAGLGLLIGLEREYARVSQERQDGRRDARQPDDAGAPDAPERETSGKGARTFTLIALYGYGAALCGERYPAFPVVALLCLGLLLGALQLARRLRPRGERAPGPRDEGPPEDVTTEVAALSTAVLGLLVRSGREAAVTLGLLIMAVLLAKPYSRRLVPKLRRQELTGTLQLLVALLVVLPIVPNQPLQLWGALGGVLNPRTVVLFVVLTASIGYVGYFMVRVLGAQRGLPLTGLVGGLTSSTAVTLAMGEHVRAAPGLAASGAVASLLACAVMVVRVVAITAVVYAPLGRALLPAASAMVGGYLLGAALLSLRRRQGGAPAPAAGLALDNPFELGPALKFGALYAAVLVGAKLLRGAFGARGFYLASALAGLADVDSITLAAARLTKDGAEALQVGATAIWVGILSNTLVKTGMAFGAGGRGYGGRVLLGNGGALALGGGALAWQWLR